MYGSADLVPIRTEQIILSDGKGTFGLSKDGTVVVLSGYSNVGSVFVPETTQHSAVLGNLASVGDNRQRILQFTGRAPPTGTTAVVAVSPSSVPTAAPGSNVAPGIRERWWFWPAVGTAGVVVTGLVLWQVAGALGTAGVAGKMIAKRVA